MFKDSKGKYRSEEQAVGSDRGGVDFYQMLVSGTKMAGFTDAHRFVTIPQFEGITDVVDDTFIYNPFLFLAAVAQMPT